MTWWQPAFELGKKYAPTAAKWLASKVGADVLLKRIELAVSSVGDRQKAIKKARQFDGRFGSILIEGRNRHVVYRGETPIDAFPSPEGDLVVACEGFDLSRLRSPDDLTSVRAREWARTRLRALGERLRRHEAGPEATAEDVEGVGGADLVDAEADIGKHQFDALIGEMGPLLDQLTSAPAKPFRDQVSVPTSPGVYVFSEGPNPIYVGQSRNLRQRLRQHTSPKSHENQAPLAFNIALKDAAAQELALPKTRKQIEADAAFQPLFAAALGRVRDMDVRFIEIEDPVVRTVFEIYASRALETDEFNSWETH